MARRDKLGFIAIRTEGGLLPPSILQRIHRLDPTLGGLNPEDYGLSGTKIREAASQAWNALQGPWRAFQAERTQLAENEAATGMTRRKWLDQVLKALDYGSVDLAPTLRAGDRTFAISHLYKATPMHLIGCGLDLEKRTKGATGAATSSPHGIVQLFLNADDSSLWGFLSNGLRWRVLRDSVSLSRLSYVEFDLEAILEGQLYDEFLLFWLVCHQTRVKADRPDECWLEKWHQAAGEEGKRALSTLRSGVEKAIEALGQGFLRHPENKALRERIRAGELDKQDYYRQLLRMVYRLLFLFVAEDRGLLLHPNADESAKRLFTENYGTQRIRLLAERLRGSRRYHDLFVQLKLILKLLGKPEGCPELGLPALGGFLFSEGSCPDLDSAELSNADLLEAIRFLAVTQEGGRRSRVDYKNLASEEMGSVYESLLELHPDLRSDGSEFKLGSASGNERKTTGSYYTPDSLIQCLLDTALEPVVADALKRAGADLKAREAAILDLKVIDPAVGSGHFLIAAAHRLAKRLAQVRSGEDEPSPEVTRHALRDVIGRCLYGIDLNPMAAELCKVALWMEALEPGKPLSFLDHHIVVGNSLLGTTPELIAKGIPDGAYDAIEGDDKEVCKLLKKQNKLERDVKQGDLFDPHAFAGKNMLAAWQEIESIPDEDLEAIRKKEKTFRQAEAALAMRKLIADTWSAAFTLPKTPPVPGSNVGGVGVTTATIRRLLNGQPMPEEERSAVQAEARRFGFLHPHLAFPGVFAKGGFDVVLGNPPWERVKLQEKEFFAERRPEIATARNKAERERMIKELIGTPLHKEFKQAKRDAEAASVFMRKSLRYPLAGRGDVNTYAVFAELKRSLLNPLGRAGVIVPSGIATDDTTKYFFADLMERRALASLYDFENGMRESEDTEEEEGDEEVPAPRRRPRTQGEDRRLFAGVHASFKFCLLTMTGTAVQPKQPQFAFFLHRVSDLSIPGKAFTLTLEDIALLNPNTKTCPVFRKERDAEITKAIYRRVPILIREGDPSGNPWGVSFQRMFDMSNDSELFRTETELMAAFGSSLGNEFEVPQTTQVEHREVRAGRWLPIFEGKMVSFFDHRFAHIVFNPENAVRPQQSLVASREDHLDPDFQVRPYQWAHEFDVLARQGEDALDSWEFVIKRVSATTNERTAIGCILPAVALSYTLYRVRCSDKRLLPQVVAGLTSFAFDYCLRQKTTQPSLPIGILEESAFPTPKSVNDAKFWSGSSTHMWIAPRVLELTYVSSDLQSFARDLGFDGPPFKWDEERRFWLRAELDAAFFHLYGIDRDDVDYIMESFPTVKRRDITVHGTYRTKEAILSIYDEMAEVSESGGTFTTKLDPPPANGWVPPPLPPLSDLIQKDSIEAQEKPVRTRSATPKVVAPAAPVPKMANLFEEAPKTLFDEEDEELEEPEAPAKPVVMGRVLVNGKPAQLIGKKALPNGVTDFQVILDETGEVKKYVSPPARIETLS